MKVIEKYLKSIIWLVFIASIFMGVVGEVAEDIFVGNSKVVALAGRLVTIILVTLIDIVIIKKVADSEEKGIKFKTYAKVVLISIMQSAVTWVVAYGLVQLKPMVDNLAVWGIFAVLMYILKIMLSFAVYVAVLEDAGVVASIAYSMRISIKKENILRILLCNIGFVVILLVANMLIKTIDTLLAVTCMEIASYVVFIANEILYLKCKKVD